MIYYALEKYKLEKNKCFLIGDKNSDVEAAKNAGIKGYLFKGGNLLDKIQKILQEDYY